jgi:surfeit locus 1 family protein
MHHAKAEAAAVATGFRPQLRPTLFALPIVLLCLGLGFWQVQRLHWKEALIAERAAALAGPAIPAPSADAAAYGLEFHHVVADGVLLNDKEIFLGATAEDGDSGYQVLTPLRERGGRMIFINRGFIPSRLKDRALRSAGELEGPVRIRGLLRLPPAGRPNWFLPDNRPDLNYWFWVDLPAMATADKLGQVAGFYIDADATPNRGGWPEGGVTRLALPNNHLQYAITWFSLAVAMIVIYVVFHRHRPEHR